MILAKSRFLLTGVIAFAMTATMMWASEPVVAAPPTSNTTLDLVPLGTYSGVGGVGASEIVAFDSVGKKLYITNGVSNKLDIVDISTPSTPSLSTSIDMGPYGIGIQSVAVSSNIVAVAVEVSPTVDGTTYQRTGVNGRVVLLDSMGAFLKNVEVGVLPDHVSFTPDNKTILVANEGEPLCSAENPNTAALEAKDPALATDPIGSVSLIDVKDGADSATVTTLDFAGFNKADLLSEDVRVFFPGSSAAQDLEPEYITTNESGTKAYVTLQEANSIAIIDLVSKSVLDVVSLGYKDWGSEGLLYDGSKVDGPTGGPLANPISYEGFPLKGMYMPDTIASYTVSGQTYLVAANEGDTREYSCFNEESTFGDTSGSDSFSSYWDSANNAVKSPAKLGAQKTTLSFPTKTPVVGVRSNLYTFGGRSFSIRDANGSLVWDSGSAFEEVALRDYPNAFNSDSSTSAGSSVAMVQGQPGRFDGRSTSKGVEPEALAVGSVGSQSFAFIGLERMGGIMAYDISNPNAPKFIKYTNLALAGLSRTPANNTTPGSYDVSPESLVFVPAIQSPTSKPLLIVGNELSGTSTIYEVRVANAGDLVGGGAFFQGDFATSCAAKFNSAGAKINKGINVSYTKVGSGTGRTNLGSGTYDWAGTDSLGTKTGLTAADSVYIPVAGAPIAVFFNLSKGNRKIVSLNLDASVISGIFKGTIENWNDPAIKALNPAVSLPATAISTVVRADSSEATNIFADFLKQNSSGAWTAEDGSIAAGFVADFSETGSSSLVAKVESVNGAIGYADLSDLTGKAVYAAAVKNGNGKYVKPSTTAAATYLKASGVLVEKIAPSITTNGGIYDVDFTKNVKNGYQISFITYMLGKKGNGKTVDMKVYASYVLSKCSANPAGVGASNYATIGSALIAKAKLQVAKL